MKTILLGGYYGAGNVGDEAILEVVIDELRERCADLSFIVLSWDPERTSTDHGVASIFWKDIEALLDAVASVDLIVLGGGGIFHDYWGIDIDTYLSKDYWDITAFGTLPLLSQILKIPCIIAGVGVGPLSSDAAREHTRLAFESCLSGSVRDQSSLEALRETGFEGPHGQPERIIVAPDIAFRLKTRPDDAEWAKAALARLGIAEGKKLLGLSLRYWESTTDEKEHLGRIARGIRQFLEQNPDLDLITIPFQVLEATPHTNDLLVLDPLADLVDMNDRVHRLDCSLTPRQAQAVIGRCDLMLGMRLHSVVMSINVGTPVVALSYAPKVVSAMGYAGIGELCNSEVLVEPARLAGQLQRVLESNRALRQGITEAQKRLSAEASAHTEQIARALSSLRTREKIGFAGEFVLRQARLLHRAMEAKESYRREVKQLRAKNAALQSRIESDAHKLADYALLERSPLSKLVRYWNDLQKRRWIRRFVTFYTLLRREGPSKTFDVAWGKAKGLLQTSNKEERIETGHTRRVMAEALHRLRARHANGVFILTSTMVFDELYNQRIINLSKYLAKHGWVVVFVAWRWHPGETMPSVGQEVYPNVVQVPVDIFLEHLDVFEDFPETWKRRFVVEFPYPEFFIPALRLRSRGFFLVYDIIDEWEEFHKTGQAIWFDRDAEEAFVFNANLVTAVSPPLIDKFSPLRTDVRLVPNGFDPALLGPSNCDMGARRGTSDIVHMGYFGHLTASWFDWAFISEVLDEGAVRGVKLHFHLIGYGEDGIKTRMAKHKGQFSFYGSVHPRELHQYVKDWDVAFIFFRDGKLSEAVDPIKIYEYLYFGLPVVVKGIPHLKDTPMTVVVDSAHQLLDCLADLQVGMSSRARGQAQGARDEFLEVSTWDRRFEELVRLMENRQCMCL